MARECATEKIDAEELRELLDTMTPLERQCATAHMAPLVLQNLCAAPEPVDDQVVATGSNPFAADAATSAATGPADTARSNDVARPAALADGVALGSADTAPWENVSLRPSLWRAALLMLMTLVAIVTLLLTVP